ncbi:MAG: tetratricopeptide repeat protein [Treponema sp.]|jgi:tetratricopeptide (TPR) repeat protein|nr:tetratricopeptide repeat protein [Treponema sp.]
MKAKTRFAVLLRFFVLAIIIFCNGCSSFGAISAEEYFSIGMAYFDMGKFAEAEKWLIRAKAKDKTMNASEYNLGRIAFETGRYEEALKHFNSILRKDPNNVLALKAAAYTYIRNGQIEKAEALYDKILSIVPESADDGYNYALVLYYMEKYAEAEQVLKNHEFALLDNNDVLLLYARTQKQQGKPEAIDTYANWLTNNNDAKVRYEYAQLLESHEMYARSLEEYRLALEELSSNSVDPSKPDIRFAIAHVILTADSGNAEGMGELKGAVLDGFSNMEKMQELLDDERIRSADRDEIRQMLADMKRAADAEGAGLSEAAGAGDETPEPGGDKEAE